MASASGKRKTWLVQQGGQVGPRSLKELRERLLYLRGVKPAEADIFFRPRFDAGLPDPQALSDLTPALDRLASARQRHEQVIVYGDYDADGITATALLLTTLRARSLNATPYLPDRHGGGYGLHHDVLASLHESVDLIICVDCGITSEAEVAWLNKHGVDVIIIDHHTIPERLPPATAIIHPQHPEQPYPTPWLCSAGLAWKVAQAMWADVRFGQPDPEASKWLLDLAALGTIADMVPLKGENRALVTFGLEVLRRTGRPGLRALLRRLPRDRALTTTDVAFKIVPPLNAAGRMAHPQIALDLLLAEDDATAANLLTHLNQLNNQRQVLTAQVVNEALAHVNPTQAVLFAANRRWPAGVVGLVAGRLSERFGRPAIVVGSNGTGAIGSARSPMGDNIMTILHPVRSLLLRLGGHAQAAGFATTWENITALGRAIQESTGTASSAGTDEAVHRPADSLLPRALIRSATAELLEQFAPFGVGNPEPHFVVTALPLLEWRPVGRDDSHAKCTFLVGDEVVPGIGFGLARDIKRLRPTRRTVDIIGTLSHDDWRGHPTLQLTLKDMALAGTAQLKEVGAPA